MAKGRNNDNSIVYKGEKLTQSRFWSLHGKQDAWVWTNNVSWIEAITIDINVTIEHWHRISLIHSRNKITNQGMVRTVFIANKGI